MGFALGQCSDSRLVVKLQSWISILFTKQLYFPNINGKEKSFGRKKKCGEDFSLFFFSSGIFREAGVNKQV